MGNDLVRLCLLPGLAASLVGLLQTASAMALEIERLDVVVSKGTISVDMDFVVDASVPDVIAALTNFDYPDRLNPRVTAKEVLSIDGFITRIRTSFRSCLLIFCRNSTLVEEVEIRNDEIISTIVANDEDRSTGQFHWHLFENDSGETSVSFVAALKPDIFIVPVVGDSIARRKLKRQLIESAVNLGTLVEAVP